MRKKKNLNSPKYFQFLEGRRRRSRDFMADSVSQISGNSCSIPSEPPEIGNWFSSYKFESFVLDIYEDFGSPLSRDTENEKIRVDNIGESREQDRSFTEIPSSLDPASLVSEPPDIRNWCQSYIYESPALCMRDFEGSAHDERECEKDTFVNGEIIKKKLENSGDCDELQLQVTDVKCSSGLVKCNSSFGVSKLEDPSLCKIEDSNDSPSLLSEEPADVKNWFSSYTYQSPILDDSVADELKEDSYASDVEDSNTEEEESFGIIRKTKIKDEAAPSDNLSSSQFEMEQRDNESTSIGNEASSSHDRKSTKTLIGQRDTAKNASEAKLEPEETHLASKIPIRRGASFRKPAQRRGKENEEAITENGFITTRKNRLTRQNQEITPKRTQKMLQENVVAGKSTPFEKRMVLGESTNIQHREEIGVTGKWRCPRKNKPQRGPPLKQLRLEQWVHRV